MTTDVCYKYDSAAGGEIRVTLPKGVDRRRAVDICDAVEAAVAAALSGKKPDFSAAGKTAAQAVQPELEYVPFPTEGTVTMKEITAAWKISQATYYRHLDIYPNPLKMEGAAKNAPARFDAAAVAHAFGYGHVERRRREVRSDGNK